VNDDATRIYVIFGALIVLIVMIALRSSR